MGKSFGGQLPALLCTLLPENKKGSSHDSPNPPSLHIPFHFPLKIQSHRDREKERDQKISNLEMRSRASSKHGSRSMEVGKRKLKEEPHLSGAYIRSLVKQLSSSTPKEPMNPKSPDGAAGEGFISETRQQQEATDQPQPKKPVRRRLHTSRPYQERLLNMAEARREIVTALKLHRASMKQANEQQQQQPPQVSSPPTSEEPHREMRTSRKNPFNYFNNPSFPSISYPPFSWAYTSIAPLPIPDNLTLTLPSGPLGLNLNLDDFINIDTTFCNNNSNPSIPSSAFSSSSCSYPYSSPPTANTTTTMSVPEVPSFSNGRPQASDTMPDPTAGALHPALDDEVMAEIRSIGEQHSVEWNDKLNLVTSAWWSKFLKTMEMSPQGQEAGIVGGGGEEGGDGLHLFDEEMDIPAWLSDQQQLDDYYTEEYLQDAALPCLDIGEIEGMDCEWLS